MNREGTVEAAVLVVSAEKENSRKNRRILRNIALEEVERERAAALFVATLEVRATRPGVAVAADDRPRLLAEGGDDARVAAVEDERGHVEVALSTRGRGARTLFLQRGMARVREQPSRPCGAYHTCLLHWREVAGSEASKRCK